MKTLVLIGPREINGHVYSHGDELPPSSLPPDTVAQFLDRKWLVEVPERRSLYRLFPFFSGAEDAEPLDQELTEFALPS